MGLRYYTTSRNIRSKSLTCRHIQAHLRSGQTLAEYALILAFISVVAIGVLMSMGNQATNVYGTVNTQLKSAENGGVSAPAHTH
jgi:Flp pilus assembly pilin Flp